MGRRNGRENVYNIRLGVTRGVNGRQVKSVHVVAKSQNSAVKKIKGNGRIVSIRKVSVEELFGTSNEYVNSMLTPEPSLFVPMGRQRRASATTDRVPRH